MTSTAIIIAFVAGVIASIVGGIIGGILVGAKHIGAELAAIMGGFYGPVAGFAGVAIGLVTLFLM